MMLQGRTVEYLIRRTYAVQRGQIVLLHAAAGGVGLIASQWLKHLGATVIGTAGGAAKAELARAHGCDHVIDYRHEDVAARGRELTNGKGVPVVYDGVGRDTFAGSLASLAPRGLLVSFGNASGAVEPFAPALLRSEEHTSELQSLMRISYAVFCLKKNTFAQIYRLCNSATQHVSAKESECFIIC